jgi:glucose/arabinose dehydrogenase
MLRPLATVIALSLAACGHTAELPLAAGTGPATTLPEPSRTLLPTVQVAEAAGWPAGATPVPAAGLRVQPFATGLSHPR